MNPITIISIEDLQKVVEASISDALRVHLAEPAEGRGQSDASLDPFYTFKSLGELLQTDVRTLRRWELEGLIPTGLRIGGVVRWPARTVNDWVEKLIEAENPSVKTGAASPVCTRLHDAIETERRTCNDT